MESRTRFAIGGMTTVAASVAVICVVALTNTVALSEAAGSSIEAGPVVVPFSGVAKSAKTPTNAPASTEAPPETPVAEVVPAPAPEVVSPRQAAPSAPAVPTAQPSHGGAQTPSEDEVTAEAGASGSGESAREWATRLGWSEERIAAWIAEHRKDSEAGDRMSVPEVGSSSEISADTTQERSLMTVSPQERPARAGADADHRSMKPGGGEKKDRSRVSPDRRDR